MTKKIFPALLVSAGALFLCGLNAADSFAPAAASAITGAPTDQRLALILTGVIGFVVGGTSFFFRPHR